MSRKTIPVFSSKALTNAIAECVRIRVGRRVHIEFPELPGSRQANASSDLSCSLAVHCLNSCTTDIWRRTIEIKAALA